MSRINPGAIHNALVRNEEEGLHDLAATDEGMNYHFEPSAGFLPEELKYSPPLILAATYYNAVACIDYIFTQGVENEQSDLLGRTVVHFAAMQGNMELLQYESFSQYDFNARDWRNRTPLHYAVMGGKQEVVTHLIEHEGAEVNVLDRFGYNAITMAAEVGNLDLLKFLIDKGGHIVDDRNGYPPLLIALQRNRIDVFNFLLRYSPQVHSWTKNDANLFHFAAQLGRAKVIESLAADFNDLDANVNDKYGYSPLHYAVLHGHVAAVKALLKVRGVDPQKKTGGGLTTLFLGIHYGQLATVQLIWEAAIVGNPRLGEELDDNQSNALHLAALHAHMDLVKFFLEKRVSRIALDRDGKKAQELSSGMKAAEITEFIINWKDPNEKDDNGGCCCCCEVA
jgi:ankyrin repeat protein